MQRFLNTPHLPAGEVSVVLCEENPALVSALRAYGVETLEVPPCGALDGPVGRHPDMQIIHTGGPTCIAAKNASSDLFYKLSSAGLQIIPSHSPVSKPYPNDVGLNFALLGTYVIGRQNAMDGRLKERFGDDENDSR